MADLRDYEIGFSDNSGKYCHDKFIECDFILQNQSRPPQRYIFHEVILVGYIKWIYFVIHLMIYYFYELNYSKQND